MRCAFALAVLLSLTACTGVLPPDAPSPREEVLAAFARLRTECLRGDSPGIPPGVAESLMGTIGPLEVKIDGDHATVENGYFAPDRYDFERSEGEWRLVTIAPGADLRAPPLPLRLPSARTDREYLGQDPGPVRLVVLTADGRPPSVNHAVSEEAFPSVVAEFPAVTRVHLCSESAVPWRRVAAVLSRLAAEGQWRVLFETAPDAEGRASIQRRTLDCYLPSEPIAPGGVSLLILVVGDAQHVPALGGIGGLLGEVPPAVLRNPILVEFSPDLPFQTVVATIDEIRAAGQTDVLFVAPGAVVDPEGEPGVSVDVVPLDSDGTSRLISPRTP